jgi:hypothetical protein
MGALQGWRQGVAKAWLIRRGFAGQSRDETVGQIPFVGEFFGGLDAWWTRDCF